MRKVLVVDDEEDIGMLMKLMLRSSGYNVTYVSSFEDARAVIDDENFDVIFLDLNLNGQFGLSLLPNIREQNEETNVVIITAQKEKSILKKVRDQGIKTLIEKPFTKKQILSVLTS